MTVTSVAAPARTRTAAGPRKNSTSAAAKSKAGASKAATKQSAPSKAAPPAPSLAPIEAEYLPLDQNVLEHDALEVEHPNVQYPDAQPPQGRGVDEQTIVDNLPLVGYLVNEILGRLPSHVNRDELTSAGMIALVQAGRSFDPSRGVPFARFASTRIRGALIDELRSADWASRSVRARARKRDAALEALTAQLGRTPTTAELAETLGVPTSEIDAVEGDLQRAVVLSLQGFAEGVCVEDFVSAREPDPEEILLHRERVGYLLDAVAELPDRLKTVVTQYFLHELPMAEIAEQLQVSESRISQMRAEALSLLKDALNTMLDPAMITPVERPDGCAIRRRHTYFAAVAEHRDFKSRLGTAIASMPVAI